MIVRIKYRFYKVAKPEKMSFAHFAHVQTIPPDDMRKIFASLLVPIFGKWSVKDYLFIEKNSGGVTIEKVEKVCSFFLLNSKKYVNFSN